MKAILIILILFYGSTSTYGQIDGDLVKLLDSLVIEDQKWRGNLRQIDNNEIDTMSRQEAVNRIRKVDSTNFHILERLYHKFGFIGYNIAGQEGSHNFWLLVQHQDKHTIFQETILEQMKLEAEKGNASFIDYAYLIDRVKVNTEQLQIYGTQMTINEVKTSYEPKPVIEPSKLNERREKIGLPPIELYIKIMNERYFGSLDKN